VLDRDVAVTPAPPPPLDPECAAFLEAVPPFAFTAELIATLRTRPEVPDEVLTRNGAYQVRRVTAPGRDGGPVVPLVVATPVRVQGPLPVVYSLHGGGMVTGTASEGVGLGYMVLPEGQDAVVVAPEYRLAPENRYPAALEDSVAGLVWAAEHAEELGGRPDQLLLLGASAGGGLGAATCLVVRDEGLMDLAGAMLLFPMLDDRNDSVSARQMAHQGIWRQTDNAFGWSCYLGDDAGGDGVSPYAAPGRATDVGGLPPLFLDVASNETFRDEVVDFASSVWAQGGAAELHVWPGGFHGHSGLNPGTRLADVEWAARQDWVSRLLSPVA
jgi:acetyl esterase/lipase